MGGKSIRPQGGLGPTLVGTASREAARHTTSYWATVVSVGRETVDVLPDDRSGLQQRIPVSCGPARKNQRVLITVTGGLPSAQIPGRASAESIGSLTIQTTGGSGAGGGGPIAVHDLDGPYHTGLLGDAQAPQFLMLDGSRTMSGDLGMDTHYIHNVIDPFDPQDAATKQYVDDAIAGVTVTDDLMVGDSGSGGVAGDVPAPGAGDAAAGKYLKADGTWSVPPGTGSGGNPEFDMTRARMVYEAPQAANTFKAGPESGGASVPTVRAIVAADLPALNSLTAPTGDLSINTHKLTNVVDPTSAQDAATKNYTDSQDAMLRMSMDRARVAAFAFNTPVMIGDSGSGGAKGVVPAPAAGDAAASKFLKADGTWATVSGASGGTVTSVGLTMPSDFTVSSSPVTSSGTIAVTGGTNFLVAQVFS